MATNNFLRYFKCKSILIFLFFTIIKKGATNVTISDHIETDKTFYFHKLSLLSSKLATIDYSVNVNVTDIGIKCVEYKTCLYLDIYTTEDNQNLKTRCVTNIYGQLRNENLHIPMRLTDMPNLINPGSPDKFNKCKMDDDDSSIIFCTGRITIQDYLPRNYGFSFGYDCAYSNKPSLRGLSFNISIFGQTNETICTNITEVKDGFFQCHKFYSQASLPNMLGDLSADDVHGWMGSSAISTVIALMFSATEDGLCYKHASEILCHGFYPRCDSVKEQIIHPCKETCDEFFEACTENILSGYEQLMSFNGSQFGGGWRFDKLSESLNCTYLPSLNDPFDCVYKPVTCEHPPGVDNARIINYIKYNGTYVAKSQIQYECVGETFQMEGNSIVTCLYSGKWNKIPKCLRKESTINLLIIVLPVLIILSLIFITTCILKRHVCVRKNIQKHFTRVKQYDAFVCYDYNDRDQDFAEITIRSELEGKCDPPFKLCLHRRDFKAAVDIMWNIRNAIQSSNSAIIVMSQQYVDSLWCKEEFEQCYMENIKDPAFKLFVIMLQPIGQLDGTSEYMKSFFANKTYLERNDPTLFKKIEEYLSLVKKPQRNP